MPADDEPGAVTANVPVSPAAMQPVSWKTKAKRADAEAWKKQRDALANADASASSEPEVVHFFGAATGEKDVPAAADKPESDTYIWVRRQWNGSFSARYRLADLQTPHWSNVSGGVRAPSPRPFVHGYVMCDGMVEGELDHSCEHGEGPHRIKVCVVAKDNDRAIVDSLKQQATENQRRRYGL